MIIDAKLIAVLVFIIINFFIVFVIKTRTTIVISLIVAHLVAVLFFSLSISNYNSFKEIVLSLIVYSMVILFLISNYNPIYLAGKETTNFHKKSIIISLTLAMVFLVFISIFFIAKNIAPIAASIKEKQIIQQQEEASNPMILPSKVEISAVKRVRLKYKLSDNFLLKRSSDVILIIVAITSSLLILATKTKSNS